jgi:hypothetical protein
LIDITKSSPKAIPHMDEVVHEIRKTVGRRWIKEVTGSNSAKILSLIGPGSGRELKGLGKDSLRVCPGQWLK